MGDRTLLVDKGKGKPNPYQIARLGRAWDRAAEDGRCSYCGHGGREHRGTAMQPHFYARTSNDDPKGRYFHFPELDEVIPLRKYVVAKEVELATLFCMTCAEDLGTDQVMCFQRTDATGEFLGIEDEHGNPVWR